MCTSSSSGLTQPNVTTDYEGDKYEREPPSPRDKISQDLMILPP